MVVADLKGKKITVMGLGLHGGGVGTARFLVEAGAMLTITDMKSKDELASSVKKLDDLKNVRLVLGQHRPEDFSKADIVIKNPGIPWTNKYIKLACDNKVPVEMDSSLFFKLCKNPIVGVTGTKGKTTTSTLIYEILKTAGKNPVMVGVGQTSVLDKLKDLKKESIVVFELSSWRLSALGRYKLSPRIAVITNIYPDHLNYYKSMDEYVKDKKYICLNQDKDDTCVISGDNEILASIESEIRPRLIKFSKKKVESGRAVFADGGIIYYADGNDEKKVMDADKIALKGEHNLENVLAAVGAAVAADVDFESIRKTAAAFAGVPHRLEPVRELRGVKYVNDTAATMPEAAIFALKSFSEPIILICGGSDKNLEMTLLAKAIDARAKDVIFLRGAGTDKILAALENIGSRFKRTDLKVSDSMENAVGMARAIAQKGNIVLLSPGAASFGMFLNEFDRGDKFREAVNKLS